MPFDPTIPLKVHAPEYRSPFESIGRFLTLRDMVDQRRMRELQMRRLEMQEAQAQREYDEYDRFERALPTLTDKSTLTDYLQAGGIRYGLPAYKAREDAISAGTTRQKAQVDLAKSAQGLTADQKKTAFNELFAIRSIPDPDAQGQAFMEWMARNQDLGFRPVGWPLGDREIEFAGNKALGVDEWRKFKAEQAKAAHEESLYPFKVREQIANTATAEGKATGTTPLDTNQRAQLEQGRWGSPEGLISVLFDPKASDTDKTRAESALQRHMELRKAGAASTVISPNQNIANEAKLRDDYIRDTKTYPIIRDAYSKIVGASQSQTGPGDISLVYGYMRMLDPGSTVREGEFATAQNAGGVPERIRAYWNKLVSGERLDPKVRAEFVAEAKKIYDQSHGDYSKTRDIYSGIATRGGMDPRNVVIDLSPTTPRAPASAPTGVPKVGDVLPNGKRVTKVTEIK